MDRSQEINKPFVPETTESACVLYLYFYTEWNDKIVALEKTTWFHFRLTKTGFLFLFFFFLLQTIY